MIKKPRISLDGTYIFDADTVGELDELSLTTVIGEATASVALIDEEKKQDPPETKQAEANAPADSERCYVDDTINEFLEGIAPEAEPKSE